MSISRSMARFTLAHTRDGDEAVAAIEVLGEMARMVPTTALLPGAFVERQRVGVGMTVYMIEHCKDAEALRRIKARDTRVKVQKALSLHPVLSEEIARELGGPEDQIVKLLAGLGTTRGNIEGRVGVLEELLDKVKNPTDMVNRVVLAMAKNGIDNGIVLYLSSRYNMEKSYVSKVWKKGSYSDEQVINALQAQMQPRVALALYTKGKEFGSPQFGKAIAEFFVRWIRSPKNPSRGTYAQFFNPEGVAVMVQHPEWYTVLAGQEMSDAFFVTLLNNTPSRQRARLAWVLQRQRSRLVELIGVMEKSKVRLSNSEQQLMCACVNGIDDSLFHWILAHCTESGLLEFLSGRWTGHSGRLYPSHELAVQCMKRLGGNDNVASMLAKTFNNPGFVHDELASASLDVIGGLAWLCRDEARCGPYIFSRLTQSGAGLEKALEQFELMGATASLDAICGALTSLARGENVQVGR